ncbi:MAG: hypothetical protein J3K34DRAFT_384754 [Monoraphidium minutum]|nr:MAG: hypothetical protein J3K34DRAFT_384754 [Monoraphidium minutum]
MASAAAPAAPAGVQKALQRVKAQLDAGAFYEAQQMYKTTYHRYHSRKQLEEAYAVLREGAAQQLRAGQITCGAELGAMLVDALAEDRAPADPPALAALSDIVRALPPDAPADDGAGLDAVSRFVAAGLKWAHKQGADAGVRALHDLFAGRLLAAYGWRQLGRASMHYARGADADAFAAALASCAAAAPPGEQELFVARAVLQTLACAHPATLGRQLQHADALLAACRRRAWAGGRPLPDGPLLHFAQFLLTALQQRSAALARLLRDKYAAALGRDASLAAYLERVEELYLNTGGGGGGGGLLAGLLRGLLEGDEED